LLLPENKQDNQDNHSVMKHQRLPTPDQSSTEIVCGNHFWTRPETDFLSSYECCKGNDMENSLATQFRNVLTGISAETIESYEHAMTALIDTVNKAMQQREDLGDLIGPNPVELMFENHTNHAHFMLTQLRLKSAKVLLEGIFWAYHTYTNRGFSPNYFPIELATWKTAIMNRIESHHAESIMAVYQLMIDHHRDFLFFSQQPSSPIEIEEALLEYFKRYLEALLVPNMQKAMEVSREYIQTVWDIPNWWERVISPSMYEIGRLWADGEITVGQEHIATSITQRVISMYYPLILELPRTKGAVIVAVSPEELHEIGARMVADMLEMHGWDVYYTGANTPQESLIDLIHSQQAHFLCISTTLPSHLLHVEQIIKKVRAETFEQPVHVLVGGQAYMGDPDLWKTIGADGFVLNASQSVNYLQAHQAANGHGNGNGYGAAGTYAS
jgi:methanogenic corrinoid protein MtbC1